MSSRSRTVLASVLGFSLFVAACSTGGTGGSGSPTTSVEPSDGASVEPTALVVGLGYIPSVQFAPFYRADQAGYYAEAGLDVEFQNKIDPDLITLVGQGSIDVGIADGTSVIPAVSQGIPVRYLATIYGKFPSIVFSKASAGIDGAADLAGKKLGIPGRYGSSWIMLQALLASANLTPEDLQIVEYPDFGQGAAVAAGAVDAATGFANNEPVQLELSGTPTSVLTIDDITPLPGPGLIAGTETIDAKGDALRGFVAATLRAMEEISATPSVGLEAAIAAVPELASARDTQAAILDATIASWTGPVQEREGLGALDLDGWESSIDYLGTLDLVPNPVTVEDVVAQGYLPGRD
ncbi:MAG TPA: ABC transporter substrate-binding protein [Candidatus Saccharimonadales bacterium]|nr:ABC transporter substrate-binding protein [Candidatus Saccharimonadales bacterium]